MAQPLGQVIGTRAGSVRPAAGTVGAAPAPVPPAGPDLSTFRRKYPEYNDLADGVLVQKLEDTYAKSYSDIPKADYWKRLGITPVDPLRLAVPAKRFDKGMTDAAVQGLSLGFSDEIGAAGDASIDWLLSKAGLGDSSKSWSDRYGESLTADRAGMAQFSEDHPIASTGAMLAGGLALPMPNFAAGSALGTVGRMAGTGAAIGGVAGFGSSEGGLGERMMGAGTGALLGGALGAALPGLAVGANKLLQTAKNITGLQDPAKKAADFALRGLRRDNLTLPQAANQLATTKPVMLADLGENMRSAGRLVQTIPGPGKRRAMDALKTRQMGQGERVVGDVRKSIANVDFMGTKESLMAARSASAKPLYDEAFALGPVTSTRIEGLLKEPIIKQGIAQGLKIQRIEAAADDVPFNPYDYAIMGFDSSGAPILGPVPNVRLLDAAKRGLDDILEKYRNTTTHKLELDQEGHAIERLRKALVKELDRATTDATGRSAYAEARQSWAGPSQSLDAMAMGRRFAQGDSEVVARTYQGLSPTDREFFKMGVVRQIEDTIMKSRDGWDVVVKIFGSKDQRARLRVLFDSDTEFATFRKALEEEARSASSMREIMGNSVTGRIAAEQEDAGILERALLDVPHQGIWGSALSALSRGVNRAKGINEGTADELSKLLFADDPGGRLRAIQALIERQNRNRALGSGLANLPGRLLGTSANVGAQRLAPVKP